MKLAFIYGRKLFGIEFELRDPPLNGSFNVPCVMTQNPMKRMKSCISAKNNTQTVTNRACVISQHLFVTYLSNNIYSPLFIVKTCPPPPPFSRLRRTTCFKGNFFCLFLSIKNETRDRSLKYLLYDREKRLIYS